MKHKCWKYKKGERPNVNHHRFLCLKKKGFMRYVEKWSCWNCGKKIEFKIPFWKSIGFEKTIYWKAQKCHKSDCG